MEKESMSLVKEILESIVKTKDFAISQAPDIVNQLLRYNFWLSIIGVTAGIILLTTAIYCFYCLITKEFDSCDNKEVFYWVAGITCGLVSIPFIICNTICLVKICVAPKLFIIQEIAMLL